MTLPHASKSFMRLNPHLFTVAYQSPQSAPERERTLHDQILAYCADRRWYCEHDRMDRATGCVMGAPDFTIAVEGGRTLWVECKSRTGKLSAEQEAVKARLERLGHRYVVVRSMKEFLEAI